MLIVDLKEHIANMAARKTKVNLESLESLVARLHDAVIQSIDAGNYDANKWFIFLNGTPEIQQFISACIQGESPIKKVFERWMEYNPDFSIGHDRGGIIVERK